MALEVNFVLGDVEPAGWCTRCNSSAMYVPVYALYSTYEDGPLVAKIGRYNDCRCEGNPTMFGSTEGEDDV